MSRKQEINITISKKGEITIDIDGVVGPKCLEITKKIEELLGSTKISRETKSEYYSNPTTEEVYIGNGENNND